MKIRHAITQHIRLTLWCIGILAVIITVLWLFYGRRQGGLFSFSAGFNKQIDETPIQVESIRRLAEWEFLSIQDEEMMDTTVNHWWKQDDRLIRIYRGTLRLGVDFRKCQDNWAVAHGDTAIVTLPPIQLLSNDFIDDARTRSFYEQGDWDAAAYKELLQRARQRMLQRGLTRTNIKRAEENARTQVSNLFRSLGYPQVRITVSPSSSQP